MLYAAEISQTPSSIAPIPLRKKKEKKKTTQKEYMSTKLVPMLDAASNVCKSLPFASSYRHTAATPMRRVASKRNEKNITRI